jgi:hypothetical protein
VVWRETRIPISISTRVGQKPSCWSKSTSPSKRRTSQA